ncbi:3'(2'),5'-bisphosphate nucleotidase CysQ family protein [Microvirga massiliensis]|uniref:3'(2'),5'-bisphosphate nucleotidase CysQ family protein n=1 Tax=Microvirga massiliensis TaxID=1033741 RepID=UPI00062B5F68|nr:3'(2'),5'-bisphosphate nucleotidase CysQ [Microvirga massiliensis]
MPLRDPQPDPIALKLSAIAIEAGLLLQRMEHSIKDHRIKEDGTPTTGADLAAEKLIIARLGDTFPGVPIVAEETANAVAPEEYFFLVDPLDGTGDYIRGTGEYSVNIALVKEGRPIAGVIAAPALKRIWIAGDHASEGEISDSAADEIAWRPLQSRIAVEGELVALVSRRHGDATTDALLDALSIRTRRTASSAVKFGLIAAGEADVYIRCGPTMEWDTAAGDHILTRAGGRVIGPGGTPMTYGHQSRGYRNGPFAAVGDTRLAQRVLLPATASA